MNTTTPARPRLFLIDGHNHIFRAFYAIRGMTRADGQATNAVYGFTSMLRKLIQDEKPDYLAVTFDVSRHSFRTDLFPDYKGNRSDAPEDLIPQFSIIYDLVKAYNVPALQLAGWEADDLMATLAVQAEAAGLAVTIVSTDKDLCQLVTEHIHLLDPMKDKRLGPDEVVEKMGVPPELVVELQGLCGDTSDNIPGIPGVGMKTAAKLVHAYGSIEGVYAAIDAGDKGIKGKRLENLVNFKDNAFLSRTLATLSREVPVEETFGIGGESGFAKLTIDPPNVPALRKIFADNQLRRFLAELPPPTAEELAANPDLGDPTAPARPAQPAEDGKLALPPVPKLGRAGDVCVLTWRQLAEMCAELSAAGAFAFDTETTGLDPIADQLVGMSFAVGTERAWYVPLRHQNPALVAAAGEQLELGAEAPAPLDPRQLPVDAVLRAVAPLLEDPGLAKSAQNGKFDLQVYREAGITVRGFAFDTMLASYLCDAHQRSHNMDAIAKRWLDHETIHFADLTDAAGNKGTKKAPVTFDRVPLDSATAYACEDAQVVAALEGQMRPALANAGLTDLHDELELPLAVVLADMERAGIRIDSDKLRGLSAELGQRAEALVTEAEALVGRPFNLGSPKQLQEILFSELGLPSKKRTKTGFSTDSGVLEQIAHLHELPRMILAWRQATKLKSTYTDVLPTLVHPLTGRIHTQFQQAVAATGRLSSSDPNLQNIPVRTEDGARIRDAFIPADGCVLLAADYSQIELRVLAHLCGDPAMKQAFVDGADVHARTASLLFDVPEDAVKREQRAMAKTVNFGILYGMSASRLAREQGISTKEAKGFITRYFARFPDIEAWKAEALDQARTKGYAETLLGRIRKLPELRSRSRMAVAAAERVAVNTPIQGSAADIIKQAMVELHARLAVELPEVRLLLQVHDELVLEVPEAQLDAATALSVGVMEGAFDLHVPLVVNASSGQTWLEAH